MQNAEFWIMTKYYMRVITTKCDFSVEDQLLHSVRKLLQEIDIGDISFQRFIPYWKTEGFGELNCQFSSDNSLEIIQSLFATHWDSNTADSRWSNIRLPHASFLWISN